jgi:flagellar biosynthetic protein FliP
MVTSFTRIVVVMSILRYATGLQQSPPTSVIMALSLLLTGFVMQPTMKVAYDEGVASWLRPSRRRKLSPKQPNTLGVHA